MATRGDVDEATLRLTLERYNNDAKSGADAFNKTFLVITFSISIIPFCIYN